MKKYFLALLLLLVPALPLPVLGGGIAATVYKSPTCGCCQAYAEYLRGHGFDVEVVATERLAELQRANGVPARLAGCHSTRIGGYTFEGHVPAESIKRFLSEKPAARGLTVPGMPAGSPGMGGRREGPLHVYYLDDSATMQLYDTR
ncbi:MAG TPA: DUF411 domain-containing protein [Burkholderiales bacterium]